MRHAFEVNALFGDVAEHVDITLKEPKAKYTFMDGNYIQYNPYKQSKYAKIYLNSTFQDKVLHNKKPEHKTKS